MVSPTTAALEPLQSGIIIGQTITHIHIPSWMGRCWSRDDDSRMHWHIVSLSFKYRSRVRLPYFFGLVPTLKVVSNTKLFMPADYAFLATSMADLPNLREMLPQTLVERDDQLLQPRKRQTECINSVCLSKFVQWLRPQPVMSQEICPQTILFLMSRMDSRSSRLENSFASMTSC